ncbi:hypothetical protein [Streptomyces hirsutus]|uniref:hypothetical protein n=1 Tax=Streptomyces hirsutus TaxID=35620 RepID=UPI003657F799
MADSTPAPRRPNRPEESKESALARELISAEYRQSKNEPRGPAEEPTLGAHSATMADSTPAPRRPNRLEESKESALARELISAEYRQSKNEPRGPAEEPTLGARALRALRDMWRSLRGGSRSGPSHGSANDAYDGGMQAAGPYVGMAQSNGPVSGPTAERQWAPSPEQGSGRTVDDIRADVDLLSLDRKAFEDAVLHHLRNNDEWGKAYALPPLNTSYTAQYANNAYGRELTGESSSALSPVPAGQDAPRLDLPEHVSLPDGNGLWDAASMRLMERATATDDEQRAAFSERFTRPATPLVAQQDSPSPSAVLRSPGGNEAVYDGNAFNIIEQRPPSSTAPVSGTPATAPSSPMDPLVSPPVSPLLDPVRPVGPMDPPVSFQTPMRPITPLSLDDRSSESLPSSLLGAAGLAAVRDKPAGSPSPSPAPAPAPKSWQPSSAAPTRPSGKRR